MDSKKPPSSQKTILQFFKNQPVTPIEKINCPGCSLEVPKRKLIFHLDHQCKSRNKKKEGRRKKKEEEEKRKKKEEGKGEGSKEEEEKRKKEEGRKEEGNGEGREEEEKRKEEEGRKEGGKKWKKSEREWRVREEEKRKKFEEWREREEEEKRKKLEEEERKKEDGRKEGEEKEEEGNIDKTIENLNVETICDENSDSEVLYISSSMVEAVLDEDGDSTEQQSPSKSLSNLSTPSKSSNSKSRSILSPSKLSMCRSNFLSNSKPHTPSKLSLTPSKLSMSPSNFVSPSKPSNSKSGGILSPSKSKSASNTPSKLSMSRSNSLSPSKTHQNSNVSPSKSNSKSDSILSPSKSNSNLQTPSKMPQNCSTSPSNFVTPSNTPEKNKVTLSPYFSPNSKSSEIRKNGREENKREGNRKEQIVEFNLSSLNSSARSILNEWESLSDTSPEKGGSQVDRLTEKANRQTEMHMDTETENKEKRARSLEKRVRSSDSLSPARKKINIEMNNSDEDFEPVRTPKRAQSPENTPDKRVRSEKREKISQKRATSPEKREESPENTNKREKIPPKRACSPEKREESPENTPNERVQSQKKAQSPQKREISPQKRAQSEKRAHSSPPRFHIQVSTPIASKIVSETCVYYPSDEDFEPVTVSPQQPSTPARKRSLSHSLKRSETHSISPSRKRTLSNSPHSPNKCPNSLSNSPNKCPNSLSNSPNKCPNSLSNTPNKCSNSLSLHSPTHKHSLSHSSPGCKHTLSNSPHSPRRSLSFSHSPKHSQLKKKKGLGSDDGLSDFETGINGLDKVENILIDSGLNKCDGNTNLDVNKNKSKSSRNLKPSTVESDKNFDPATAKSTGNKNSNKKSKNNTNSDPILEKSSKNSNKKSKNNTNSDPILETSNKNSDNVSENDKNSNDISENNTNSDVNFSNINYLQKTALQNTSTPLSSPKFSKTSAFQNSPCQNSNTPSSSPQLFPIDKSLQNFPIQNQSTPLSSPKLSKTALQNSGTPSHSPKLFSKSLQNLSTPSSSPYRPQRRLKIHIMSPSTINASFESSLALSQSSENSISTCGLSPASVGSVGNTGDGFLSAKGTMGNIGDGNISPGVAKSPQNVGNSFGNSGNRNISSKNSEKSGNICDLSSRKEGNNCPDPRNTSDKYVSSRNIKNRGNDNSNRSRNNSNTSGNNSDQFLSPGDSSDRYFSSPEIAVPSLVTPVHTPSPSSLPSPSPQPQTQPPNPPTFVRNLFIDSRDGLSRGEGGKSQEKEFMGDSQVESRSQEAMSREKGFMSDSQASVSLLQGSNSLSQVLRGDSQVESQSQEVMSRKKGYMSDSQASVSLLQGSNSLSQVFMSDSQIESQSHEAMSQSQALRSDSQASVSLLQGSESLSQVFRSDSQVESQSQEAMSQSEGARSDSQDSMSQSQAKSRSETQNTPSENSETPNTSPNISKRQRRSSKRLQRNTERVQQTSENLQGTSERGTENTERLRATSELQGTSESPQINSALQGTSESQKQTSEPLKINISPSIQNSVKKMLSPSKKNQNEAPPESHKNNQIFDSLLQNSPKKSRTPYRSPRKFHQSLRKTGLLENCSQSCVGISPKKKRKYGDNVSPVKIAPVGCELSSGSSQSVSGSSQCLSASQNASQSPSTSNTSQFDSQNASQISPSTSQLPPNAFQYPSTSQTHSQQLPTSQNASQTSPSTSQPHSQSPSTPHNSPGKQFTPNLSPTHDPAQFRHMKGYYLENFTRILDTVTSEEQDIRLFNSEDLNVISMFRGFSLQAQKLYVRLFQRKVKWNKVAKIEYREICDRDDTQLYVNELIYAGFLQGEAELRKLDDVMSLLTTEELHKICKYLKVPIRGNKDEILNRIQKYSSEQKSIKSYFTKQNKSNETNTPLMQKAKELLGPCCLIDNASRRVFRRVLLLYGLPRFDDDEDAGAQGELTTLLMVNMGKMKFPEYITTRQHAIFTTRDDLIKFEEVSQLQVEIQDCIEAQKWTQARDLCQTARQTYQSLIKNKSLVTHDQSLPKYLRRFTTLSLLTYLMSCGVECLQRLRDYDLAVKWLRELLGQGLHLQDYKGRWYDRLALNLQSHLKKPAEAVNAIAEALKDPDVRAGHRLSVSMRAEKMATSNQHKKLIPLIEKLELMQPREAPKITIKGRGLNFNNVPGYKRMFMFDSGDPLMPRKYRDEFTMCSVEELVIEHYTKNGYPQGLHREGATVNSIFGLFFWDILYCDIPDVFRSPHQAAPLDLDDRHFYEARKDRIDGRLGELRSWSEDEMGNELDRVWNEHKGEMSLVAWDIFKNLDYIKSLVMSLGLTLVAAICERLAKDHRFTRSGFPDIIVWNPDKKISRIVEVKGPNDRLSTKQILWLDYLLENGAAAEVCHVEAVGAKKLKPTSPKKQSPKKQSPQKQSPRKQSPKKQSPKKQSPKKQSPRKQSPKKQSPKKSKSVEKLISDWDSEDDFEDYEEVKVKGKNEEEKEKEERGGKRKRGGGGGRGKKRVRK